MSSKETKAEPAKFVPKVKRILTLPLIKFEVGKPLYLKMLDKIYRAKPIKNPTAEDAKKEPPLLVNVVDRQTGEMGQIILGAVLANLLHEDYPDDGYVGKTFAIELTGQKRGRSGNNSNMYKVEELED